VREDKAWHSPGSAVAVALSDKGGKPCSPGWPRGLAGIMSHIGSGRRPDILGRRPDRAFFAALGTGKNPRADRGISRFGYTHTTPQAGVKRRKGASAMAKLHARPSNQYRYEHYDPRF